MIAGPVFRIFLFGFVPSLLLLVYLLLYGPILPMTQCLLPYLSFIFCGCYSSIYVDSIQMCADVTWQHLASPSETYSSLSFPEQAIAWDATHNTVAEKRHLWVSTCLLSICLFWKTYMEAISHSLSATSLILD